MSYRDDCKLGCHGRCHWLLAFLLLFALILLWVLGYGPTQATCCGDAHKTELAQAAQTPVPMPQPTPAVAPEPTPSPEPAPEPAQAAATEAAVPMNEGAVNCPALLQDLQDQGLLFAVGATQLTPTSLSKLEAVASCIKDTQVKLVGYADQTGTEKLNRQIAARRAAAVKAWLQEKGLSATQIQVESHGGTAQFGSDPAQNRRVQVQAQAQK